MLVALADQAAIALEHARLYEGLEAMVAERTRELDGQKRFVEVVLETLPARRVRPRRRAAPSCAPTARARGRWAATRATRVPFAQVVPDAGAASVQAFLRAGLRARRR